MTRRTFILFTKHRMAQPGRLISFACCDPESRANGKRCHKSSSNRAKKIRPYPDVAIFEPRPATFTAILITADSTLSP